MRIAINAAFLRAEAHDGIATYARSVIKHLAAPGDEVLVYTPAPAETNGGRTSYRKTSTAYQIRSGPLGGFLRVALWCQSVLPCRVLQDRADVLLCPVPEGMLLPVLPQVVVVHDVYPLIFPEQFGGLKQYFQYAVGRLLSASAAVIAVSAHTKGDIVERLEVPEERITVVHSGIDPIFFSDDVGVAPRDHEPLPYFLFVGRCNPHKNIETVLRAYAAVHRRLPHRLVAVLDAYGKHDEAHLAELLRAAEALGIADKLQILSHLSRPELLFLYRNATALILLSKYEGFGFPPLEAMAVGTPAIVSDSTALAEVAGPGAICLPSSDSDGAAAAMDQLAGDTNCRARWSERGAKHAGQFTWERAVQQIRKVLEQHAR